MDRKLVEVENTGINWKYVALAGAVGVAVSAGVIYYYKNRPNPKIRNHIDKCNNIEIKKTEKKKTLLEEATILKDMGNKYYKSSHFEKALEYYDKALAIEFTDKKERAKIYQNKAVVLENLNRQSEALPILNEALKLDPRYEKALFRRSKLLEESGKLRDALTDVTAALYFNEFKSREYINRMDGLISKLTAAETNEIITSRGFDLPSQSYITTFLKSFPNDPLLSNERAVEQSGDENKEENKEEESILLLQAHNYDESFKSVISLFEKGTENISEEAQSRLYLLRATYYYLSCHEKLALDDLEKVISNPHAQPAVTVNAYIKKALIKMTMEEFEDAESAFKQALQIDPDYPDTYYHRGSLYENTEKFQESIDDFTRALELHKDYSFASVHRAFNRFRLNPSNNLSEFEELINRYPMCLECHLIYSQVLLNMAKFADVSKVCEKYLKLEGSCAPLQMVLSMAKLSQGNEAEAKRILTDAIQNDPKYPYTYQTLASVHMKDGNMQLALELLEKAVQYAKNFTEMRSFIATREGVRAQLAVSAQYQIPPADLFANIMRSITAPNGGPGGMY